LNVKSAHHQSAAEPRYTLMIGALSKSSSQPSIPPKGGNATQSDQRAIATITKARQVCDLKKRRRTPVWSSMFAVIDSFMRAILFLFVFGLIAIIYRMIFG
jgi:hypothetical protein